ncbi:MAG: hypothetical protein KDA24_25680 [Deltaproteobacteria bacterium]|nr:hypothetical protein [Deltaproteobacteria bacterium]
MRYRITGLALAPHVVDDRRMLDAALAQILGVATTEIRNAVVIKHSLDARRRPARHVYSLEVDIPDEATPRPRAPRGANVRVVDEGTQPAALRASGVLADAPSIASLPEGFRPVVVGAGPAGLFAALALARLGAPPILLERGEAIEPRAEKVQKLWGEGELDPESNMLFGEGGAGAFSDGKIYTRTRNPQVSSVLKELVELGANPRILVDARPHIGADVLRRILSSFRGRLQGLGVELRYGAKVVGLLREGKAIVGVRLEGGEELRRAPVLMAPGHSARDTFAFLLEAGIPMEAWSTALGVRIEHPQQMIDRIQYKSSHPRRDGLPPADYHLAWHGRGGRGSYTFCNCPGGRIVSATNLPGHIVTNGLANSTRDGQYANSAVVVQVRPDDYLPYGSPEDPLIGFRFQDVWEEKAFALGGGGYRAPAQRVVDYLDARPSSSALETSYAPGTTPSNLRDCLPEPVADAIAQSLHSFGRRLRGFDGPMGVLVGVESRTSCPVRILRDDECRALDVEGFYPVGEGAGYAGGIVSAAVDGIRAAESMFKRAKARVAAV